MKTPKDFKQKRIKDIKSRIQELENYPIEQIGVEERLTQLTKQLKQLS